MCSIGHQFEKMMNTVIGHGGRGCLEITVVGFLPHRRSVLVAGSMIIASTLTMMQPFHSPYRVPYDVLFHCAWIAMPMIVLWSYLWFYRGLWIPFIGIWKHSICRSVESSW